MEPAEPTTVAGVSFPSRRRVWQACVSCRARKTRCDAVKPRCSPCKAQKVECVYTESQQPRIEHNTKLILERIQLLEDRLLSSQGEAMLETSETTPRGTTSAHVAASRGRPASEDTGFDLPIPVSHTANANHVYNWPLVQGLITSTMAPDNARLSPEHGHTPVERGATSVFFRGPASTGVATMSEDDDTPPETWRLFGHDQRSAVITPNEGHDLIFSFYSQVNDFFPLISLKDAMTTWDQVVAIELNAGPPQAVAQVSPAHYCRLLLVLTLALFVRQGCSSIRLPDGEDSMHDRERPGANVSSGHHQQIWRKAQLLLGFIASTSTVEAAQCTMLASIYKGAQGHVAQSYHWSHVTSTKCAELAERFVGGSPTLFPIPEAFKRLYWIAYIFEGDFTSEISVTLPSGIAKYEDSVPYPTHGIPKSTNEAEDQAGEPSNVLSPFQISTNAAIRRLLNRVHSMFYDRKDHFRMPRVEYVAWMFRVADDFWSYHADVYRNVPGFLFIPRPGGEAMALDSSHHAEILANNPWNVLRLKGRQYAAQHIIYRPFIDYVLLNSEQIDSHPEKEAILQKCGLCLEACKGFINVFDVDEANSMTCLFATGMASFTYIIILRIATFCPIFEEVVPSDAEQVIATGKRNMNRFSVSIPEFAWHLQTLERLDQACRRRMT